ncbi:CMP-N-acetylneuraminate-beta-galactosamide-alpha-2,3-sialyltransferase 2-like [Asterias amurensis]|uniref:CMP-N-acetylneuraminate-beta-galactosamide- alpha-2,3-sialyltransferase 2-like n=1 Tax=Asterias amurensis TaxID=7602 RepID=UPI003AB833B5
MRARLKMPVVFATFLIIISLYVYIHEIGFSQATVSDSHESSFFSLSSVRRFFTTQLTVPENVRTLGTLNSTDGCRRLWLAGQSLWFDYKFNASLSPVWTRHNKKLTPVISSWWKTLQTNKLTSVPDVINEALKVISDEDPYWVRDLSRCLRCAVVGNSGNLRGSQYGQLIDSHDYVFRINKAPTKDFISDVGSKETHRFTYPESFMAPGPDANFVLMDFKLLDVAWLTSALTNGTVTRTYMNVKKTINVTKSKVMIYNPSLMHHIHTEWMEKHGRYPSTGNLAMFFALQICDEVNLFGYGANSNGNWDHYWQKDDGSHNSFFKKTGVHDSDFERLIMMSLQSAGKIKIYAGVR